MDDEASSITPGQYAQYGAARLAAMAVTMFDVEVTLDYAAFFGRVLHRLDARHRQRTARHLALAFPELAPDRLERLTVACFEHLAQLAVEVLHTPRLIHPDSWSQRLRLVGLGPAIQLLNAGKPVIMITGHLGNWEVLGRLLALLGYPCAAIARPLNNPLINTWLLGLREQRGVRIITKWDASQAMLEVLDQGGALGFIADQNAGEKGLFVPFFGRLASTYKSIGLLALAKEVPLICGYARRRGDGYDYELGCQDVIYPHEWTQRPDPLFYVTARYMRAIEQMVRDCPWQYLWMHRRWKTRPRHEREGKPMPANLRRRLEELPWMDQATMQRLMEPLPA